MLSELPQWEAEYRRLPGSLPITRVILAGALVAALALTAQPATDSGRASLETHPSPACSELARLHRHGVTSGPWAARVRVACSRSSARP